MPVHDQIEGPLDYEAEVRPDGVIDIPGDRPAPHGPGLSKGLAMISLGLLIAGAGYLYGGLAAIILTPIGGALALWTALLLAGIAQPKRHRKRSARAIVLK